MSSFPKILSRHDHLPRVQLRGVEGTVHMFDPDSGRLAIDTPTGFSIFEVSSGIFSEGDLVSWGPYAATGAQEVTNKSSGQICRGYFLNHRVPATLLKANL